MGIGGSCQISGAQLYLSDISTIANRARTMVPNMIAFNTGTLLGPALGGCAARCLSPFGCILDVCPVRANLLSEVARWIVVVFVLRRSYCFCTD